MDQRAPLLLRALYRDRSDPVSTVSYRILILRYSEQDHHPHSLLICVSLVLYISMCSALNYLTTVRSLDVNTSLIDRYLFRRSPNVPRGAAFTVSPEVLRAEKERELCRQALAIDVSLPTKIIRVQRSIQVVG